MKINEQIKCIDHVLVNIRTYDFWTVVKESGIVTQQLCRFVFVHFREKYRCRLQNGHAYLPQKGGRQKKTVKWTSTLHLSAGLTVNSSHGELVTCDEFTFSPKSELVTVNSSQRLSYGTVNSPHGDHQTMNSSQWTRHTVISSHWRRGDLVTQNSLLSSQGLSQHLLHRFTHPPHRLRRVCSFQSKLKP